MRLALVVLLAVGAALAQDSYDVRLFSVQAPTRVAIADAGGSGWKLCASCPWQQMTGVVQLSAEGTQVRVVGHGLSPSLGFRGRIRLTVEGSPPLELDHPLAVSNKSSRLRLVAAVPRERYVEYVLAGEANASDPPEYLRAMAIAARTYARHFPDQHKLEGFNFCDTTHCQNARLGAAQDAFRSAVEATHGELLWYRGTPAATYYHRHCGGQTAAAKEVWPDKAAPYLVSQADTFCPRESQGKWQATITKEDLTRALRDSQISVRSEFTLSVQKRASSGRIALLSLNGRPLSPSTMRFAIGRSLGWNLIRSDWYDVQDRGSEFLFTGQGHGHGVGLCQIGARQMAREGKTYREILAFYFPGTSVGLNAQGFDWKVLRKGRLELRTTQPDVDSKILDIASTMLPQIESQIPVGLAIPDIQLRVFGNTSQFRDATGEPGWVAASTRGRVIRLQPLSTLESRRITESTLRHELIHAILEANTTAQVSLWFKEGLVLYLTNEAVSAAAPLSLEDTERQLAGRGTQAGRSDAYAQSKKLVEALIARHGIARVIGFLQTGLPADGR